MKSLLACSILAFGLSVFAQEGKNPNQHESEGVTYQEAVKFPSMRPFFPKRFGEDDVLLEVNSRHVQRVQELAEIFKDVKPGTAVKYKVKHKGKVEETQEPYGGEQKKIK